MLFDSRTDSIIVQDNIAIRHHSKKWDIVSYTYFWECQRMCWYVDD